MKPTLFHPTFHHTAVGVFLAAAVLASAGALVADPPSVDPPTAAEHEAAVAWCRIRTLRQEIGLTSHNLAARACTPQFWGNSGTNSGDAIPFFVRAAAGAPNESAARVRRARQGEEGGEKMVLCPQITMPGRA